MILRHGKMSMQNTDKINRKKKWTMESIKITWLRRSKGRYGSLNWTTIQILMGRSYHHQPRPCLSPSIEGDRKKCCLRTLYFKSFIIKRFNPSTFLNLIKMDYTAAAFISLHTLKHLQQRHVWLSTRQVDDHTCLGCWRLWKWRRLMPRGARVVTCVWAMRGARTPTSHGQNFWLRSNLKMVNTENESPGWDLSLQTITHE